MGKGLRSIITFLRNGISLPGELETTSEYKVMHLSDTPSAIYPAIKDLLAALRPDAIIHTGDIADDIKLGYNANYLEQYRQAAGPFLKSLALGTPRLYIVPGNHDSVSFIKEKVPKGSLVGPGSVINIKGSTFAVAHYLSDLPGGAQHGSVPPGGARYNLYGHNLDRPVGPGDGVYLNGIRTINVILLPSGRVINLSYPGGTNRYRKYKDNPPTLI